MKTLPQILNSLEGLSDIELFVIDLFCGAGGMSEGVEKARIQGLKCAKVFCCVNHDKNAIYSHNANIPDALHFIEDIRTLDLAPVIALVLRIRNLYPEAKIMLHASLECTNFSKAKGGQSRDADSRTLADHLFRYIDAIVPDYIQIENVEEFMTWGPLIIKTAITPQGAEYCPCNIKKEKIKTPKGQPKKKRWILTPQMLPNPEQKGIYYHKWVNDVNQYGYRFDKRILNSADFGARTSRKRFFGIFAKDGLDIVFPKPTHSKTGASDLFDQTQPWLPVKDVLDLSDEGVSIFDRNPPLAENTYVRHLAGLIKFVAGGKDAYLVKYNSMNRNGVYHAPSIGEPCPVVSCQNRLAITFVSKYFSGHPDSKNIPITGPIHTVKCKDNHSLVTARFFDPSTLVYNHTDHFFDMQYGNGSCVSIDAPAGTITNNPKHCLITCKSYLMNTNFNNVGSNLSAPSPTITANRKWHYLVNPQYRSAGGDINKPCFTIIARTDKMPPSIATCQTEPGSQIPSFIRITPEAIIYEIYQTDLPVIVQIKEFMALYGIIDIKMRMLKILELLQIMGFPIDYVLVGSQQDRKKFIGNAVEVNQAKANTEALCINLRKKRLAKSAA